MLVSVPASSERKFGPHFLSRFHNGYGTRGNVNGSPCDDVDISDLTYLVEWMFSGGPDPLSMLEADVNGNGPVDISDLTYLVAWLFGGGPDPAGCP